MPGKQFFLFIIKSIVLGLVVAALMLVFMPDLRSGTGFGDNFFSGNTTRPARQSHYTALSRSAPAVVNIYSVSIENDTGIFRNRARERASLGSGVIMTENGYLLTCNHVVENADSIFVAVQDGRVLEAQIVGTDQLTDLAVL